MQYPYHRIVIARHGNTFHPDEPPRRIGSGTDIPLKTEGKDQAIRIQGYLRNYNMVPERVVAGELMRTRETAKIAADHLTLTTDPLFNEIDYGPDENRLEDEVIDRIGYQAMDDWNNVGIIPPGWICNPDYVIKGWKDFADDTLSRRAHTVLVVTSNGIARFAPHITGDFENFCGQYKLKLPTGGLGCFEYRDGKWHTTMWGLRP